ncbi:GNAT family N-acetyltransferase [Micromonospora sp. SD12]|uniref:GNAT family N-acetyltransferase n=1 Tax=Micromonospora sp. SD12 TaxID=3452216 RepID=UPI003F8CEDA5
MIDDLRLGIVAPPATEEPAEADRMAGRLALRRARYEDLPAMARAHVELLPMGLFPALGARFVRRWQRTYLNSPYGVGAVVVRTAARQEEIVAFVLGASDHAAYTAELARDRRVAASLALAALGALIVRPAVAVRVLRTRVRPLARRVLRRRAVAATPERNGSVVTPHVAVMTALAVRPDSRMSGIGVVLAAHFVDMARDAGAMWVEAQTSIGPLGATGFYERLGWEAGADRPTPDGDSVRTYRLRLADAR